MKLHDATFERTLTRRIRQNVRASARLRAQRPGGFWSKHFHITPEAVRVLVPVGAAAAVMAENSQPWPPEARIALAGFVLAFIHAMQRSAFTAQVTAHADIAILHALPADHSLAFRWVWRTWWRRVCWAFVDAVTVLTTLSVALRGPRVDWNVVGAFGALHAIVTTGWIVRPWRWLDRALIASGFIIGIAAMSLGKEHASDFASLFAFIEPATLAFPAGWLAHAFVECRTTAGAAWLAAVVTMAVASLELYRRCRADWRGRFQAAFDTASDAPPANADADGDAESDGVLHARPAVSPEEVNATVAAIESREWLHDTSNEALTPLQRRVAARLAPREHLLTYAFADGLPNYAATWYRTIRFQLICVLVVIFFAALDCPRLAALGVIAGILSFLAIVPVGSMLPRMAHPSGETAGSASMGLWLPISLREIPALDRKLCWPLWLVAAPWCAAAGALIAWHFARSAEAGAVFGLKAFLLAAPSRPFLRVIGTSSGQTRSAKGCAFLIACALLMMAGAGSGVAFLVVPLEWAPAALAGVWLCASAIWLLHVMFWRRLGADAT